MAVLQEPLNLGDLLKYEAPNLYSRERVTVAAGQTLPLGTVVGMVTATGKVKQLDPSATDGSQYAAGVLMQACDAHLADRDDGLLIARHAIVASHALQWPAGIAAVEQLAAISQLKALGVLVRIGA
ncbi:head decoration protein [Ralstonia solanacearum]|uniref:head decoration protein n=1 Tax=Ralstonia solanacearum TaxID=305 RepID=UPI0001817361|nr:head decoration protein [Ralstonia solanacearum]MDC6176272.1 head decoration protein [Ralstonia solanacearum]MDC6239762.1 head decoration protein [Ralstonia solanacearum]TYZ56719.1 head decoration protein [Ralstonia solanacearum]